MNPPPTCTYCTQPVAEGYVALCAAHLATCIPCMTDQHAACCAPCVCEHSGIRIVSLKPKRGWAIQAQNADGTWHQFWSEHYKRDAEAYAARVRATYPNGFGGAP